MPYNSRHEDEIDIHQCVQYFYVGETPQKQSSGFWLHLTGNLFKLSPLFTRQGCPNLQKALPMGHDTDIPRFKIEYIPQTLSAKLQRRVLRRAWLGAPALQSQYTSLDDHRGLPAAVG